MRVSRNWRFDFGEDIYKIVGFMKLTPTYFSRTLFVSNEADIYLH